jgi:hypothetical protein
MAEINFSYFLLFDEINLYPFKGRSRYQRVICCKKSSSLIHPKVSVLDVNVVWTFFGQGTLATKVARLVVFFL